MQPRGARHGRPTRPRRVARSARAGYTCRVPRARSLAHLSAAAALALAAACEREGPRPVGEPNPTVVRLADAGWISNDTLIRIDPVTGEETVETAVNDMRPDTLADGTAVYRLSEYLPVFAGCADDPDPAICTQTRLNDFVAERVRLPRWARVRDVSGTVVATFVIGPDGRVRQTGIERSMGDEIDRAVLLAVDQMPAWSPGFHGGEPVAVRWRLPVTVGGG